MTSNSIGDYDWKNTPKDVGIPKKWNDVYGPTEWETISNVPKSHYTISPGFDSVSDIARREKQQLLRAASKNLIEIWETRIKKDFSNIDNYRENINFISSFITTIDIFSKTFRDIFIQRDKDLIVLLRGYLGTIIQYCEIVIKNYITNFSGTIIGQKYNSIDIIANNFDCIKKLLIFFQENKYTVESYPKALQLIVSEGHFDEMRRIIENIEHISKKESFYRNSPEEKSDFSNLDI